MYAYPWGFQSYPEALPVLAMVIVPALLMVSTIRFRSFKNLDFGVRRSYPCCSSLRYSWRCWPPTLKASSSCSRMAIWRPRSSKWPGTACAGGAARKSK